MENSFSSTMDFVNELNKSHGVKQRGGKMYTQVVHRMEAFRRFHGLEYGVDTKVLVDDGHRVVIKAVITNANGVQLGSGMAEEIRGQGHVNTTSALENCETSAIGRALSSLGISGGEYASANEMDGVVRKQEATANPAPAPAPAPAQAEKPQPSQEEERMCNEFLAEVKQKLQSDSRSKITAWANTTVAQERMALLERFYPDIKQQTSTEIRNHISSLRKGS